MYVAAIALFEPFQCLGAILGLVLAIHVLNVYRGAGRMFVVAAFVYLAHYLLEHIHKPLGLGDAVVKYQNAVEQVKVTAFLPALDGFVHGAELALCLQFKLFISFLFLLLLLLLPLGVLLVFVLHNDLERNGLIITQNPLLDGLSKAEPVKLGAEYGFIVHRYHLLAVIVCVVDAGCGRHVQALVGPDVCIVMCQTKTLTLQARGAVGLVKYDKIKLAVLECLCDHVGGLVCGKHHIHRVFVFLECIHTCA